MRTLAWITAALLLALPACNAEPQEVAQSPDAPAASAPTEASETAASPAPSPTGPEASATPSPPATGLQNEDPPTETGDTVPARGRDVELWFLRNNGGYKIEPEVHQIAGDTQAVARATLELLVDTKPRDPALANVVRWTGTRILGVSLKGTTLTVDLAFPDGQPSVGAGYEGVLFEQLIHTGAQFPTVDRVRILEDGQTPQTPHGIELDEPRAPDEASVSPVVILDPAHRETVSPGRVTVRGTANVFEATVVLRLVNPSGKTVRRTFTTATCGTGCRGDWTHTFGNVRRSGTWTVVAAASDPSDGEGSPPYTTKRRFVVP